MRYTVPIVLALALVFVTNVQASSQSAFLKQKVAEHRSATWYWQDVAFVRHTKSAYHEQKTKSVRYLRWLAKKWYDRRVVAKRHASSPPHYYEWLCIHSYEGAWNDPGAPYYGGLQMDWGFMQTYGSRLLATKGTADHWTPLEQMWVAERAHASGRGFYPWPNTARYCNLL